MHEHSVYRGKVLSFAFSEWGGFGVTFHELPSISRDDIVLPEEDLAAIERHTIEVSHHAGALRAAGRHLMRGLVLYGPPGTGKTLSVMSLCSQMPGRTTLLLSGPGAGALGQAARACTSGNSPSRWMTGAYFECRRTSTWPTTTPAPSTARM